jgi:hypothetical protein
MRRATFVAGLLLACVCAASARADGDPASDYLYAQKVFFPFDVKIPKAKQEGFTALVDAANRSGYKIRVALIGSSYDLGSVTPLWGKPRQYARFLDVEISFLYKHRLLVVMPNGFGFAWPHHPSNREYAVLSKIRIHPGGVGLVDAAQTAVQRLATASGVKIAHPNRRPTQSSWAHHRAAIILGTIAVLLAAALIVDGLRRRR